MVEFEPNPNWAQDYKEKIAEASPLVDADIELLAKHPPHNEQPADTQGEQ